MNRAKSDSLPPPSWRCGLFEHFWKRGRSEGRLKSMKVHPHRSFRSLLERPQGRIWGPHLFFYLPHAPKFCHLKPLGTLPYFHKCLLHTNTRLSPSISMFLHTIFRMTHYWLIFISENMAFTAFVILHNRVNASTSLPNCTLWGSGFCPSKMRKPFGKGIVSWIRVIAL